VQISETKLLQKAKKSKKLQHAGCAGEVAREPKPKLSRGQRGNKRISRYIKQDRPTGCAGKYWITIGSCLQLIVIGMYAYNFILVLYSL
jgi:hypothetical protein